MKLFFLLVSLVSINHIVGAKTKDCNDGNNAFTIPRPAICANSRREIYTKLIKNSNRNFVTAYQRYLPKECNFASEVVKIVEAYRNAANYVVIFLNKASHTDEQFNEVVKLYDYGLIQFNEAIRKMALEKHLTNVCFNSLMLIQGAVTTTGEGLVAGTIIAYNSKCPSTRVLRTSTHRPIKIVSNYLN